MTTFSWDRKCLLFTNHALVLGVIAADPAVRIRDIAERVEITERAVEILLGDLIQVGFLTRKRVGRRNVYEVHQHEKLRHPLIGERDVAGVVRAMLPAKKQPKLEVAFANPRISPAIPEQSFARAARIVHPMNMSTVTSTKKGVTMKQVLVYVVVAVLLLFASAALAATTRWHRAEHRPAPMHHTPGAQKQGRAQGAQGPPTSASSNPTSTPMRPASRVRHRYPANLHAGIHRATTVAGGGQPGRRRNIRHVAERDSYGRRRHGWRNDIRRRHQRRDRGQAHGNPGARWRRQQWDHRHRRPQRTRSPPGHRQYPACDWGPPGPSSVSSSHSFVHPLTPGRMPGTDAAWIPPGTHPGGCVTQHPPGVGH